MKFYVTTAQLYSAIGSLDARKSELERAFDNAFEAYREYVLLRITSLDVSRFPWRRNITCPDTLEHLESLITKESDDLGAQALVDAIGRTFGITAMVTFGRMFQQSKPLFEIALEYRDDLNVLNWLILAAMWNCATETVELTRDEFSVYTMALFHYGA